MKRKSIIKLNQQWHCLNVGTIKSKWRDPLKEGNQRNEW